AQATTSCLTRASAGASVAWGTCSSKDRISSTGNIKRSRACACPAPRPRSVSRYAHVDGLNREVREDRKTRLQVREEKLISCLRVLAARDVEFRDLRGLRFCQRLLLR